jgi:hypothetical protein
VKFGAHQGTDVGYNVQAAVDSKNKLIATFDLINNSTDHGQLYNMSNKAKSIFQVETIESLADKGYFDTSDLKECEENNIVCYVAKPKYQNSTGNPVYFSDKFKYNPQDNTYTCGRAEIIVHNKKIRCKRKSMKTRKHAQSVQIKKSVQRPKAQKG